MRVIPPCPEPLDFPRLRIVDVSGGKSVEADSPNEALRGQGVAGTDFVGGAEAMEERWCPSQQARDGIRPSSRPQCVGRERVSARRII
jgi:hypothetical protein